MVDSRAKQRSNITWKFKRRRLIALAGGTIEQLGHISPLQTQLVPSMSQDAGEAAVAPAGIVAEGAPANGEEPRQPVMWSL